MLARFVGDAVLLKCWIRLCYYAGVSMCMCMHTYAYIYIYIGDGSPCRVVGVPWPPTCTSLFGHLWQSPSVCRKAST